MDKKIFVMRRFDQIYYRNEPNFADNMYTTLDDIESCLLFKIGDVTSDENRPDEFSCYLLSNPLKIIYLLQYEAALLDEI